MLVNTSTPFLLLLAATSALARTNLSGCTSFVSTVTARPDAIYQTVIYYVPDSLEICSFVDCGGGRAPPKSVPGCPLYKGTELPPVSFLSADPHAKPTNAAPAPTAAVGQTTIEEVVTSAPSSPSGTPVSGDASNSVRPDAPIGSDGFSGSSDSDGSDGSDGSGGSESAAGVSSSASASASGSASRTSSGSANASSTPPSAGVRFGVSGLVASLALGAGALMAMF